MKKKEKKKHRTYGEYQLEKKLKKLEQFQKVAEFLKKRNASRKTKKPQNK